MCLNRIKILNKYSGTELYVDCGRCPECKVSRSAANCQKILNDYEPGYKYYFVTLTYDNKNVPYVLQQSLKPGLLSIYRNNSVIGYTTLDNYDYSKDSYTALVEHPVFGALGVLIWDDLTKFFKRLRKHDFTFTYYAVSEYGETTFRPHFHILFKTKVLFETFRTAIIKSWPMCDWSVFTRAIEPAINPASYLSLYLTLDIGLPLLLRLDCFKPKKSHSLHFGQANNVFSLANVFRLAEEHNLTYDILPTSARSSSLCATLPLPRYVVNRYFPKFKGFSKLSYDDFLYFTNNVHEHDPRICIKENYAPINNKERLSIPFSLINSNVSPRYYRLIRYLRLMPKDVHNICNLMSRLRDCAALLGVSFHYYCHVYYHVYIILFSQSLKSSMLNEKDFLNYYYNPEALIHAPTIFVNGPVSNLSVKDKKQHLSSIRKLQKYNKLRKIKSQFV